jgi:quinol monooxygenase YgiN
MLVVHVQVEVVRDSLEAFKQATLSNARASLEEPGVARFDVIQDEDRPEHFVLVEVYRTPEDPARHKETAHYQIWRDAVAPMMAEPRKSTRYHNCFPEDARWDTIAGG